MDLLADPLPWEAVSAGFADYFAGNKGELDESLWLSVDAASPTMGLGPASSSDFEQEEQEALLIHELLLTPINDPARATGPPEADDTRVAATPPPTGHYVLSAAASEGGTADSAGRIVSPLPRVAPKKAGRGAAGAKGTIKKSPGQLWVCSEPCCSYSSPRKGASLFCPHEVCQQKGPTTNCAPP